MFAIRSFSTLLSRSLYSYRYQSNTTNDSSTFDKSKKASTNVSSWATSDTNGLVKQLAVRIESTGPITIADFMRESLLHPKYVRLFRRSFPSFFISDLSKHSVDRHYSSRVITHDMKYSEKRVISSPHRRLVRSLVKYDADVY